MSSVSTYVDVCAQLALIESRERQLHDAVRVEAAGLRAQAAALEAAAAARAEAARAWVVSKRDELRATAASASAAVERAGLSGLRELLHLVNAAEETRGDTFARLRLASAELNERVFELAVTRAAFGMRLASAGSPFAVALDDVYAKVPRGVRRATEALLVAVVPQAVAGLGVAGVDAAFGPADDDDALGEGADESRTYTDYAKWYVGAEMIRPESLQRMHWALVHCHIVSGFLSTAMVHMMLELCDDKFCSVRERRLVFNVINHCLRDAKKVTQDENVVLIDDERDALVKTALAVLPRAVACLRRGDTSLDDEEETNWAIECVNSGITLCTTLGNANAHREVPDLGPVMLTALRRLCGRWFALRARIAADEQEGKRSDVSAALRAEREAELAMHVRVVNAAVIVADWVFADEWTYAQRLDAPVRIANAARALPLLAAAGDEATTEVAKCVALARLFAEPPVLAAVMCIVKEAESFSGFCSLATGLPFISAIAPEAVALDAARSAAKTVADWFAEAAAAGGAVTHEQTDKFMVAADLVYNLTTHYPAAIRHFFEHNTLAQYIELGFAHTSHVVAKTVVHLLAHAAAVDARRTAGLLRTAFMLQTDMRWLGALPLLLQTLRRACEADDDVVLRRAVYVSSVIGVVQTLTEKLARRRKRMAAAAEAAAAAPADASAPDAAAADDGGDDDDAGADDDFVGGDDDGVSDGVDALFGADNIEYDEDAVADEDEAVEDLLHDVPRPDEAPDREWENDCLSRMIAECNQELEYFNEEPSVE